MHYSRSAILTQRQRAQMSGVAGRLDFPLSPVVWRMTFRLTELAIVRIRSLR